MLVDIPPVEDESDIVVLSASCDLPTASPLDRPLIASAARRMAVPTESSGTPLPEHLRAAQLRLLFFEFARSSNRAPEMRIGNCVIRSASSVSGPECCGRGR